MRDSPLVRINILPVHISVRVEKHLNCTGSCLENFNASSSGSAQVYANNVSPRSFIQVWANLFPGNGSITLHHLATEAEEVAVCVCKNEYMQFMV